MESMAFIAPGLGLGALQKFPICFKIFQWMCPLQNENGLPLFNRFKDEIPGLWSFFSPVVRREVH